MPSPADGQEYQVAETPLTSMLCILSFHLGNQTSGLPPPDTPLGCILNNWFAFDPKEKETP